MKFKATILASFLALAALFLAPASLAQSSCSMIGTTTYCYGSDGSSSTYNRIGNSIYRYDSDGSSTYNRIGNSIYIYDW